MKHAANQTPPSFEKFGKQILPSEDPTRTRTLRARFVRQMRKRWKEVARAVPDMLQQVSTLPPAQQVDQFIVLMEQIESQTILERSPMPWTNGFISPAFARGVVRGNRDLRKLARQSGKKTAQNSFGHVAAVNQEFEIPAVESDNVAAQFAAGQRAEAFELQAASTWQGLSGVTAQVNTQVANVLAQSISSRATLAQTAAAIVDRIDKIGVTRSELIARTEVVASNNVGAVSEYAAAEEIIGEPVFVQWIATLDNRVRPTHLARHGKVFTRDDYLKLIGEPNCVVPDTKVVSPSQIERLYMRYYRGEVVTIKTYTGNKLTCTPNHPIMTPAGLKPAKELASDDAVVCRLMQATSKKIELLGIEFAKNRKSWFLETPTKTFHGDGSPYHGAFVWTDWKALAKGYLKRIAAKISKHWRTDKPTMSGNTYNDEVVSVEVNKDYIGAVYNLQTADGLYLAENIVSSNCRCSGTPYIQSVEGTVELSKAKRFKDLKTGQPKDG